MIFEPADIIITKDRSGYFGRLILNALRLFQRDRVMYQHAILVVNNETCIEALTRIKYNNLHERLKDFERYKVIRCKLLANDRKEAVVESARSLIGKEYGYGRLILQLFDQIFHTNFFTNVAKNENVQICSSLVAWAYQKQTGLRFNNVDWESCDPDDIDDEALKNPTVWQTVCEYGRDK